MSYLVEVTEEARDTLATLHTFLTSHRHHDEGAAVVGEIVTACDAAEADAAASESAITSAIALDPVEPAAGAATA